jgi:hypothetical protein
VNISINHVVNPATSEDEFHALVEYIEHKLLEWNNKKLEAQWWEECEKKIVEYVDSKMHNFDVVVVRKIERKKWGWHPLFDIFTTILALKAITICDGICNMEWIGMFYLVPWCAKFMRLYIFSKGLHIPLVHRLRNATKKNYG